VNLKLTSFELDLPYCKVVHVFFLLAEGVPLSLRRAPDQNEQLSQISVSRDRDTQIKQTPKSGIVLWELPHFGENLGRQTESYGGRVPACEGHLSPSEMSCGG